jgi:hypothetical protein
VVWEKVQDAVSFVISWVKAKVMTRDAVFIILGALVVAWFFEKIDLLSLLSLEARSQETAAIRSVAPNRVVTDEPRGKLQLPARL